MRLRDVGVEEVDGYVNDKIDGEELSDKTVANHVTLARRRCCARRRRSRCRGSRSCPKFRKPKVALFSRDYQWLRSDDEVRRFLAASRSEDEHVLVFYATAIYTGLRAGEIAALEWPDVDLDRRLITVQRSFDGPTKSDRVRYVPILDPLLPVLKAWRLRHPGRLVFTNQAGTMFAPSRASSRRSCIACSRRAEFPKVHAERQRAAVRALPRSAAHVRVALGHEGR